MVGVSALVLFGCSSLRHGLFQSTAFDLGHFDQAVYLISQGQSPVVSFWGYHVLGGHADLVLYLLAPLYKLYPSVYWLLGIQAIALSLGALPTWLLARQAGLTAAQSLGMAVVYLLYPLVFNLNLFDFHPEVIALPTLLAVVWAARQNQVVWLTLGILLILSCRDALSLTVAALGLWLWWIEKRRRCGAIALVTGVGWFVLATQVLIPQFRPAGVEAVGRYSGLGNSVLEIAQNLLLQPHLVAQRLFTGANLGYVILLVVPVLWGLSWRHLAPLIGAVPQLGMNLITDFQPQKDLIHQYSLPIVPFLLLAVISTLAAGKGWIRSQRGMILWSLVAFLALAKYSYFADRYRSTLDTWQATREAIALIPPQASVLTLTRQTPHLTHRPEIQFVKPEWDATIPITADYVLLDQRHPGRTTSAAVVNGLIDRLAQQPTYRLAYQHDGIYLFRRHDSSGN
jgi:uncharacterized membrane protein